MHAYVIRCIPVGWIAQDFGMEGIGYGLLLMASLNDFE